MTAGTPSPSSSPLFLLGPRPGRGPACPALQVPVPPSGRRLGFHKLGTALSAGRAPARSCSTGCRPGSPRARTAVWFGGGEERLRLRHPRGRLARAGLPFPMPVEGEPFLQTTTAWPPPGGDDTDGALDIGAAAVSFRHPGALRRFGCSSASRIAHTNWRVAAPGGVRSPSARFVELVRGRPGRRLLPVPGRTGGRSSELVWLPRHAGRLHRQGMDFPGSCAPRKLGGRGSTPSDRSALPRHGLLPPPRRPADRLRGTSVSAPGERSSNNGWPTFAGPPPEAPSGTGGSETLVLPRPRNEGLA